MQDDAAWLDRAIVLACHGVDAGAGGPFGAVIVRDGQMLGEGHNEVLSRHDPTAHAEVVAIRRACVRVSSFHLPDATLYTSCEPCPMCLGAAYWAHIGRIVFAATREDAAQAGFDDAHIYDELALPPGARHLPCTRHPHVRAPQPFARWSVRAGRIDY